MNNIRQFSQPVDPGPFQINNLPVVTGQGEVEVVVRDALGREQITTQTFYAAPSLLKAGLVDYSLELGKLREGFGTRSSDYSGHIVGSGSWRYGLNDRLTLESHGEAGDRLFNFGLGSVFKLGNLGETALSAAGSYQNSAQGGLLTLSHQYFSRYFSVFVQASNKINDYQDLASLSGSPVPEQTRQANLSVPVFGQGNVNLGYLETETTFGVPLQTVDTRIATLSWSRQLFRRGSFFVSYIRDIDEKENSLSAGLGWYFGDRRNATVSFQENQQGEQTTTLRAAQSLPLENTGLGWRVEASDGLNERESIDIGYRSRYATIEVGADSFDNGDQQHLSVRGAMVAMARQLFFTNSIFDSFAIVDAGLPDVQVLHENRPVGRTDNDGHLLVTHLNSFDRNRLTIDPLELPADLTIEKIDDVALPADRAGILVKFPISRTASAQIRLVDRTGSPLPLGARITLSDGSASALIGYDGIAYLNGLKPKNRFTVSWGSDSCSGIFDYASEPGRIPMIGPVLCSGGDL